MSIQASIDLRTYLGITRDQMGRDTCLAMAVSDIHGFARKVGDHLSAEYLFYGAVQRMPDKRHDRAVGVQAITSALDEDGQPRESFWPYMDASTVPNEAAKYMPPSIPSKVWKGCLECEIAKLGTIYDRLKLGLVTMIVVEVTHALLSKEQNAIITLLATDQLYPSDHQPAYHAMIALGHGLDANGDGYFLIRNSWGEYWGENGHAWVHEEYLERHTKLIGWTS